MCTSPDDLNTNRHKTPTRACRNKVPNFVYKVGAWIGIGIVIWMDDVPSADMLVRTKF